MATRVPVIIQTGEFRQLPAGDSLGDAAGGTAPLNLTSTIIHGDFKSTQSTSGSNTCIVENLNAAGLAVLDVQNDSLATFGIISRGTTSTGFGLLVANTNNLYSNLAAGLIIASVSSFIDFSVDASTAVRVMRIKNGVNVGPGTTDPGAGNLTVEDTLKARRANLATTTNTDITLLMSGLSQDSSTSTSGLSWRLGHNSSGNRQLWLGDSSDAGSATKNSFRYIVGNAVPMIDGIKNDGSAGVHINLGSPTANIGIGFDVGSATQADLSIAKLQVQSTIAQLQLQYNSTNYLKIAVGSLGEVTFDVVGTGTGANIPRFIFSDAVILAVGSATTGTAPLTFSMPGSVLLTTPVTGAMETDTDNIYLTKKTAIREAIPGVLFVQTADKIVTNTVTETSIVGTGVGTLTLPPKFFVAGKTIRIMMSGVYSTVAVTGDTVTIKIKYGSTVLASKATSALVTGGTNLFWSAELLITCRSVGGTGTVQVSGGVIYQIAGSATVEDEINNAVGTSTLDTNTNALIDVTVTHSAANASNTVKSLVSAFEVLY